MQTANIFIKLLANAAVFCVASATASCGGSSFQTGALERASFDLGCAQGQMVATTIAGGANVAGQPKDGSQVGVRGCGKKGTYIYTDTKGWILNSPIQSE